MEASTQSTTTTPTTGGSIGVPGYNAAGDQLLSPNDFTDLMGYCGNQWLSDYTYSGLLDVVAGVHADLGSRQIVAATIGAFRVMLVDSAHGTRWGNALSTERAALGEAEEATVLDASGTEIGSATVYRMQVADFGHSIDVPEPEPGWSAIRVAGADPLSF